MSKTLNLAARHRAADLVAEASALLRALSTDRSDPEVLRAAAPYAIARLFGARSSGLQPAEWLSRQGLREIEARIGTTDLGPAFDAGLGLLVDQKFPELAAHQKLSYPMEVPDFYGLSTTKVDVDIDDADPDTLEDGEAVQPKLVAADGETISLARKIVILRFTRELLKNDAIEAARAVVAKMLAFFARREDRATLGKVVTNPILLDGRTLHNLTDANDLGAGAVLSLTALSDGCGAMARQKTAAGNELGLPPRYLVVAPEKKFTALSLVKQITIDGSPAPLEVIATNRIPAASAGWYLFADPELAPVVAAATLRGSNGRTIETRSRINFHSDAFEIKFEHAFGGAILSRLGTVRGGV